MMIADGPLTVYGDSAYGTGALLDSFAQSGIETRLKTQPPRAPGGRFPKSEFGVDLDAGTVTCPAGHTVATRALKGGQIARFGALCAACPLAAKCTSSRSGRTIHLGEHERHLAAARARQTDPDWNADYTQTRPTVERKVATSCAENTAVGAPGCAAHRRSPPTSNYSPPPSTSPDSACSDSATNPADGHSAPAERPNSGCTGPTRASSSGLASRRSRIAPCPTI